LATKLIAIGKDINGIAYRKSKYQRLANNKFSRKIFVNDASKIYIPGIIKIISKQGSVSLRLYFFSALRSLCILGFLFVKKSLEFFVVLRQAQYDRKK